MIDENQSTGADAQALQDNLDSEVYAAAMEQPANPADFEETPRPYRIVVGEVRVTPDGVNPYPSESFIFFGSCINEDTSRSGSFEARFEIDGTTYSPEFQFPSLDPGAYSEVSWHPEPGSIPPGTHTLAFICGVERDLPPGEHYKNKQGGYMFRVTEPEET